MRGVATISIDGVSLPEPTQYAVYLRDVDSDKSKRTEAAAKLHRQRIRAGAYTIVLGWEWVTVAQLKVITDALFPAKLTVVFFNPTKCNMTTAIMYSGDREGRLIGKSSPLEQSRWSLSCNLIEY